MVKFDWVVEIDPFDPAAKPVKRTALGRMAHEGAQVSVAPDGRVVVFMGDDDDFEYLYRFVTREVQPDDRAANKDLLDHGTLSVAKFASDGTMAWIPLVPGEGPLTAEPASPPRPMSCSTTRAAADLLGATPMDGPEGFIPHTGTGKIYVAMTENEDRLPRWRRRGEPVNVANPRGPNPDGHLLELVPPGAPEKPDHAAALSMGRLRAVRRSGRPGDECATIPTRPPMAGSPIRQYRRRSRRPPVGVHRRPAAGASPTRSTRWTPKAPAARCRGCSTSRRSARNAAARSRRTATRCSCRCSIRARIPDA